MSDIFDQLKTIKHISRTQFVDDSFAAEVFYNAVLQMYAVLTEDQQRCMHRHFDDIIKNLDK